MPENFVISLSIDMTKDKNQVGFVFKSITCYVFTLSKNIFWCRRMPVNRAKVYAFKSGERQKQAISAKKSTLYK